LRQVGRPKKKKASRGRPGPRDKVISAITTIAPSTHHITQEVDEYLLPPCTPISAEDIECAVCLRILERPLQLPCGQLCCTPCLCAWVTHTPTPDPLSCPCCQVTHTIHESQLLPPPQVLQKLLDTLRVRCRRCLKIVTAGAHHHLEHLESSCRLHVLADEPVQETSPLRQLLSASSSPQQEVLTIPTRGRVRGPKTVYTFLHTLCGSLLHG
jgi:hypothetical protein